MDLIILFIGIPICLFFSLLIQCYSSLLIKRARNNSDVDRDQALGRLSSFLDAAKAYKAIQWFSILFIPIGIILLIFSGEQYEEIGQILIIIGLVWGLLFLQVSRAADRLFHELEKNNGLVN